MAEDFVVGIDLGTTFSAIAYVDEEKRPTLIQVNDQPTLPSVVYFGKDGVEVGEAAMQHAVAESERVVRWIKRSIGEDYTRTIDGKEYTPEEISAEILKVLVNEAEHSIGQPIKKAIITCPAWFESRAREATKKAGELAGLEVLKIVNEPTAAAIYYGLEKLEDGQTLLVYDLGGGTFDCSILQFEDGQLKHLASDGDRTLGGHDWTELLVKMMGERLAEQFGDDPTLDPKVKKQLYDQCEQAKRDLARHNEQKIVCGYKGDTAEAVFTLEEFNEWTESKLDTTLFRTEDALRKADLEWPDIDHVLLVGGSTRLAQVPEALARLTGKEPIKTGKEDVMVALGAAVLSAKEIRTGRGKRSVLRPLPPVEETLQHALGLVTVNRGNGPPFKNSIIIKRGVSIPTEEERLFKTVVPNQEVFDASIRRGDNEDAQKTSADRTYRFHCLPNTAVGSGILVRFGFDESAVVNVTAVDQKTGKGLQCEPFQFEWPKREEQGQNRVDISFVIDCTGSMYGCISAVKQEIANFCNELTTSSFDYRLALVEYRDLVYDEPTTTYDWTTDVPTFRDWVSRLEAKGGGDEPESALDALGTASEMKPREGAHHVVVLITDATAHVPDQQGRDADKIASLIAGKKIKVFAIAPRFPAYLTIVERTGGKLYDFNAQFVVGDVDVSLFRDVLHDLGCSVIRTLLAEA